MRWQIDMRQKMMDELHEDELLCARSLDALRLHPAGQKLLFARGLANLT